MKRRKRERNEMKRPTAAHNEALDAGGKAEIIRSYKKSRTRNVEKQYIRTT
jgi:hypothetical protein